MAIVQSISDAVADVAGAVRQAMKLHDGFDDIGKRMLQAWAEGVRGLRDARTSSATDRAPGVAFEGFSAPREAQERDQQDRPIGIAGEETIDEWPALQCPADAIIRSHDPSLG